MSDRTVEIVQVDAFSDRPFHGNPAAVCVLDETPEPGWCQKIAREMNLSETAFAVRRDDGDYDLSWFTPAVEVDLCGHATLATAHVLWSDAHLSLDAAARFHTRSGLLVCTRRDDWVAMDFPAEPAEPAVMPPALFDALGHTPTWVGRNRMDYLVELEDEATVRYLELDLHRLRGAELRGLIVTAAASEAADHDFVSRFFAPGVGVDEDPVTGSAHCCLAPYWSAKLGRTALVGYQASARGGIVRLEYGGERVLLLGQAVTVMRGTLLVA